MIINEVLKGSGLKFYNPIVAQGWETITDGLLHLYTQDLITDEEFQTILQRIKVSMRDDIVNVNDIREVVYISGKITGDKNYEEKFRAKQSELEEEIDNCYVITPLDLNLNDTDDYYDALSTCFEIMQECDTVYFLKDWKDSKGASMELMFAIANRINIVFEDKNDEDILTKLYLQED